MPNLFSLYDDAELETLISQIKAAIPKVLAGQRVKIDDTEYDYNTLDALESFGTGLAREKAARSGTSSRVTVLRPRRPDAWRRW
ncbi:hypothetical protein DesfrDRAFT_0139 [Solidesulfovibrio fructosivorans JJ]]|uniref:Uncharacterized protein n=1 Tax=Solidesulfovibrio fructosivorans JJ] TaxID=596151 RepID=E1JR90_SOLFR|nr:hypothetical protein [Solidesulfovibrio fructosivorans]EFL53091.1 hypothetical protein DesfrDRAFT_0139 [Solidesulfovibrio fructosivorans JJ]]